MKRHILPLLFVGLASQLSAQVISQASFLKARPKADVVVPFRVLDEGEETPLEWGLDLAWLSEENIRRGVAFAGKELIDIVRTSYMATESVEEGTLSDYQASKVKERTNIIKRYLKSGVGLNINSDHPSIDEWYNDGNVTSDERGRRWARLIDLTVKQYAALGLTNLISISPFNEPDFGWGQGYSDDTRMADFLGIAKSLKQDFDGAYDGVRICGGNTLNDDRAYEWWNYLKEYLDEGNTHQLAGNFANYARFFERVREYGHHATADELHNTMEAMVGVEYGLQTGIWWGTCDYCRAQFMKATYHANPGRRLGYGEHRNNWTSAAVYRHADGSMQAFGGTSERQAVQTTYRFASTDRPVWYNGEQGRDYVVTLPGGTGYEKGQTNAEVVVDVQSGTDIMPHIDGTYKVVNVNSGMLMGFSSNPTSWASAAQRKNGSAKYLQWQVTPVPTTVGGDFSYYLFTLNTGKGMLLDLLNWSLDAGADVGVYQGEGGSNEQWYLQYAGEGAFYIRSRHSAKCLEVRNGSTSTSANIQVGEFTGQKHQQWRFLPVTVAPDLEAPAAPATLTATGQGSSVRLEWKASASDDVASYTLLRSDNGADYYAIATGLTETNFTDNEADDETTHSYQVYAVDKSLNYSDRSPVATAMPTGQRGLVAHLPFDYTLNDTTLNGNHAALYGAPAWTSGRTGTPAIRLTGTDNFVQLPYAVANHAELTVSCWTYWRGGNAWQRLWDFGNGTTQYMFFTPKSDSGMRFAIKNGGDEQQIRVAQSLRTNRWLHVALTIGPEGAVLYIDGEEQGRNSDITLSPRDLRPAYNYVGRSQFAADPYFKGYVDDLRIYNYALSADEVKQLAETTDGIAAPPADGRPSLAEPAYDLSGRPATARSRRTIVVRKGRKTLKR